MTPSDTEARMREIYAEELDRVCDLPDAWRLAAIAAMLRVRNEAIEECAAIADDWLNQFGAHKPKFIGAQEWAADAVQDIGDEIRGLLPTTAIRQLKGKTDE